jgi:phosphomannomutase
VRDLEAGTRTEGGVSTRLSLPRSNVLAFDLDGGHRVVARPSGTEPKIKFYFDVRETVAEGEPFAAAKARAEASLDDLERAFLEVAR